MEPKNISNVYIGKSLSIKLDITIEDTVMIVHPKNINIFTGLPHMKQMVVGGIFDLQITFYAILIPQFSFCNMNSS